MMIFPRKLPTDVHHSTHRKNIWNCFERKPNGLFRDSISFQQFSIQFWLQKTNYRCFIQSCIEYLENGNYVNLLLCDLSKAFVCITHGILLDKLEKMGTCGLKYNVFWSYLSNRVRTVCQNNVFAYLYRCKFGVPQGTVWGPVLFITYVNDFFIFMSQTKADDRTLIMRAKLDISTRHQKYHS